MPRKINRHIRTMTLSVFIIAISIFNFINLEGSENVKPVQIATLIVCGMGIGVLLTNFIIWFRTRKKPQ